MSSTEEKKDFDNCLPLRLNYEALISIYITFPHWKFDQYCYVSNKLKEVEVNLKISTEIAHNELINCMKRTAKYHNIDFDNADVSKLYKMMIDDFKAYREFRHEQIIVANTNTIDNIVVNFNKIMATIDKSIVKLSTAIKSVESEDPQLNKVNYTDILTFEDCYNSFSEEQNKLIREGKDIFSKEMLSIDIKMLRTFKSRVLRIFNKYFGKDSYFGPLGIQDACR